MDKVSLTMASWFMLLFKDTAAIWEGHGHCYEICTILRHNGPVSSAWCIVWPFTPLQDESKVGIKAPPGQKGSILHPLGSRVKDCRLQGNSESVPVGLVFSYLLWLHIHVTQ